VLENIASDYSDSLKIAKLDVDHNPQTSMKFGVMSIPTLLLFKNGEVVEKLIGFMPKERLIGKIKPHLTVSATA
jgi:thioredoxin 1